MENQLKVVNILKNEKASEGRRSHESQRKDEPASLPRESAQQQHQKNLIRPIEIVSTVKTNKSTGPPPTAYHVGPGGSSKPGDKKSQFAGPLSVCRVDGSTVKLKVARRREFKVHERTAGPNPPQAKLAPRSGGATSLD